MVSKTTSPNWVFVGLRKKPEFICFVSIQYPLPMNLNLMMYIGNDLIEAVPINKQDLKVPGYLGKFKRNLKLKYQELLKMTPDPPEFLVFNPDAQPELPSDNSTTQW